MVVLPVEVEEVSVAVEALVVEGTEVALAEASVVLEVVATGEGFEAAAEQVILHTEGTGTRIH